MFGEVVITSVKILTFKIKHFRIIKNKTQLLYTKENSFVTKISMTQCSRKYSVNEILRSLYRSNVAWALQQFHITMMLILNINATAKSKLKLK